MNAVPPGFSPADAEAICDSEPIHRPGAIQPHGSLYVVADGAARPASVNAPGSLHDLLEPAAAERLAAILPFAAERGTQAVDDLRGRDGRLWLALLHPPTGQRPSLLEFEPSVVDRLSPLLSLNGAIAGLQAAADIEAACGVVAAALAAMTGFDRVMTYRFLPDWSGDVLAEHRAAPGAQSFLGLRFPASDIPAQARALYAAARVRAIPDCLAEPVPLTDPLLDLGPCSLRAVSPLHLRYLANMGVRASMSVAIVTTGGALWGLLACHHEAGPLLVGHLVRRAADTLARALAWRVAELEAAAAAEGRNRLGDLRETLAIRIVDPAVPLDAVLSPLAGRLREVARAHDILLTGPDGAARLGAPAAQAGLAAALEAAALDGRVVTDRVRDVLDPVAAAALEAAGHAGLLAFRLSDGVAGAPGSWVAWLRHELTTEVRWAGNPDKNVVVADGIRSLSPRHSFAAWREEVAGHAAPFSAADIAGGAALADALTRAMLRRADAVGHANAELRQRNEDIRFFADAAVHDLREPLWQIQVFSGMLREELAAVAGGSAEMHDMARIVESSAVRMRQLIDELANFATVGRRPERLAAEPLEAIVGDAATDIGEQLRACGGTLAYAADPAASPTLGCDRVQIRRLLQNLFSNAIKYRHPERPLAIRVDVRPNGAGRTAIEVADNGLGFDPAEAERMFEPFRRLSHAQGIEGMGLGLAICRRITDGHAGTIEGSGQPGVGARFVVDLPSEGPSG